MAFSVLNNRKCCPDTKEDSGKFEEVMHNHPKSFVSMISIGIKDLRGGVEDA